MKGEEYFKNKLRDTYELSPIKYISGYGELKFRENTYFLNWEMIITITGKLLFYLSTTVNNKGIDLAEKVEKNKEQYYSFTGKTQNGTYNITIDQLQIFCSTVDPIYLSFTCLCRTVCLNKNFHEKDIICIKGKILNANFLGDKSTIYKENGSTLNILNLIEIEIVDRNIRLLKERNTDEIKKLIKNGNIDRGIMSTIEVDILPGEHIDIGVSILETLTCILSLICLNSCNCSIIEYWDEKEVVKIEYRDVVSSPYHPNILIDNRNIRGGIRNFIECTYEKFKFLDEKINIKKFVDSLNGMNEGKYMENKIASLIMAYEYLLTKYLIDILGCEKNEIWGENLKYKLTLMKKNGLEFIADNMLSDTIARGVRNPLFHQGEIDNDEINMVEFYFKYLDLLIEIIFSILGYKGQYISRLGFKPKDMPVNSIL